MLKFSKFPYMNYKSIFKTQQPKYRYILHGNKIIVVNGKHIKSVKFKHSTKMKKFWERFCSKNVIYYIGNKQFAGDIYLKKA